MDKTAHRLKLTIAYDGTPFEGWQVQKGRDSRVPGRTVQGELERVLGRILRRRVTVVGSGRTDAGVHARAQVAHVDVNRAVDAGRLLHSANQLLPPEIAILKAEPAPRDFHARFGVRRKHYRYRIFTGSVVSPFERRYVHPVRARLNVALMRREAGALEGRHDFRAFARLAGKDRDSTRRIFEARLSRHGDELWFDIVGEGFLHTMVRSLAGTLIDVGRGRFPEGTVRALLSSGSRAKAGITAPARGLALEGVEY